MDNFELFGSGLLRNIPKCTAWGIGIVLAVLMIKRGGGKVEKLFLSGCILMLAVALVSPLLHGLTRWLIIETEGHISAQTNGYILSPLSLLGLAGLVCLIWAFWVRFHRKRQVSA